MYCSGAANPANISQGISVPVVRAAHIANPVSFSSSLSVTKIVEGDIPRWIIPAEWIRLSVVKNGEKSSFACSQVITPEEFARYVLREIPLMYSNTT